MRTTRLRATSLARTARLVARRLVRPSSYSQMRDQLTDCRALFRDYPPGLDENHDGKTCKMAEAAKKGGIRPSEVCEQALQGCCSSDLRSLRTAFHKGEKRGPRIHTLRRRRRANIASPPHDQQPSRKPPTRNHDPSASTVFGRVIFFLFVPLRESAGGAGSRGQSLPR